MQRDLLSGSEITVPKIDNTHMTDNREFVKNFDPAADRTDRLLFKHITGD